MAAEKKFFNDALSIARTAGGTFTAYKLATDSGFDLSGGPSGFRDAGKRTSRTDQNTVRPRH
jgi:hypothetical protein